MTFKLLISAAALSLVAACATTQATGPAAQDRFDRFELSQGTLDFASYEQVYLAPITASEELIELIDYRPLGATDRKRPIRQQDLDSKIEDLYEDVELALANTIELVEAPGADILTISIVLTKLEANRPTLADTDAELGLSFRSIYAGAGAAEVTFSEEDTVLATAKDSYTPSLDDTLPPAPLWSTFDRFSRRLATKISGVLS